MENLHEQVRSQKEIQGKKTTKTMAKKDKEKEAQKNSMKDKEAQNASTK